MYWSTKQWLTIIILALRFFVDTKVCSNLVTFDDVHNALQASKIVYDKSVALKLPIPYTKFKIKQLYQIDSDDDSIEDGLKVLVAEKDDEFTTLVAIKGPNGPDALKYNVYQKLQRFDGVKVKFKNDETSVNALFWKAFEMIKNNIAPKMQDQSRKYILTGHSIGGAIASILALYLKSNEGRMWENPESCLITFGQPRVGDIRYAILHDKLIDPFRKFRFVNDLDPAPHIPFWPEAVHHSREIWMTSAIMSKEKYWKICGVMEPLRGSNMWVQNPQVNDHDIRAYRDFIVHPPSVYLDTFYGRHTKWIDALENSCSGNTTINFSNDDLIPQSF
ncbi:uncharacterized protein LOC101240820 isoform X1 [Hydra vulgaris]|uniref:uncharacterized protein LOC101240820 isoform X1 n=1 Tax=Hydra vulgaris TaxID=6087 RepID=UPI001F5EE128|nr:uncharacterized protein LOC101240820 [Hydra vulgaris]